MDVKQMHELARRMVAATKKLQQANGSEPTDAEMDAYNALREAAEDLQIAANYLLTGN